MPGNWAMSTPYLRGGGGYVGGSVHDVKLVADSLVGVEDVRHQTEVSHGHLVPHTVSASCPHQDLLQTWYINRAVDVVKVMVAARRDGPISSLDIVGRVLGSADSA